MNIIGIIPARGGSKQIKKKNIKKLNGKPLISYTIEAALGSKYLSDIIVSTDDKEILETTKKFNIKANGLRPKNISSDYASTWSVMNYELNRLDKEGKTYDFYMMLQPTTPFRTSGLIDLACKKIKKNPNLDSIVSIVNVGANHPHRMYFKNKSEKLVPFVKNIKDPMMARQLLPPVFIRSGDIYLTSRNCLLNKKSLIGENSIGIEVDPDNAINIDDINDFIVAEHKMKKI